MFLIVLEILFLFLVGYFRIGHGCFLLYCGTNLCGTGLLSIICIVSIKILLLLIPFLMFDIECVVGMKRNALNEYFGDLWHKRLSHISKERILRVIRSEVFVSNEFYLLELYLGGLH